jgi:hypothetical protein
VFLSKQQSYHLFFSAGWHGHAIRSKRINTPADVLHKSWLMSELFRRSLGLSNGHAGHQGLRMLNPGKDFDHNKVAHFVPGQTEQD